MSLSHLSTREEYQVTLGKPLKGCSVYFVVKTYNYDLRAETWGVSDSRGQVVKDGDIKNTMVQAVKNAQ
jgi:hypothetical protein